MGREPQDRNDRGHGGAPLWPFALIALAGTVYLGLHLAVDVWRSWLLAGAVLAAGMAAFWVIWPGGEEGGR